MYIQTVQRPNTMSASYTASGLIDGSANLSHFRSDPQLAGAGAEGQQAGNLIADSEMLNRAGTVQLVAPRLTLPLLLISTKHLLQ